jgi:predicted dehydrogenase
MTNHRSFTRRDFLKASSVLAASAPFLLPARLWAAEGGTAPSGKIVMGFIGMGTQARGLLGGFLPSDEVQVVAICDVDTTRREAAKKRVEEHYSKKTNTDFKGCTTYGDFRELLNRTDINAVCIATPDHWHAVTATMACAKGKDVYCEKPLSLTIAEARAMVNAARQNNRVFQTGSMQRSSGEFLKACELVRNGAIGKVKEVYISVGGPSKWCDLPEEQVEPGLDWDMWLGPAPKRPYHHELSPRGVHQHFPNWRNYREYSGGMMTDWGAHHFDIAQWGLGTDDSGPVKITPPDGKDVKRLTYEYADGTLMYHGGLKDYNFGVVFVGEKGKICVDRGRFKAEPEEIAANYKANTLPIKLYKSGNHLVDFLKCVRSRQRPICDVEVGARSVTVCHLGNLAYWNKRALKWDPKTERFVGDDEANTWLSREKRAPWDQYKA